MHDQTCSERLHVNNLSHFFALKIGQIGFSIRISEYDPLYFVISLACNVYDVFGGALAKLVNILS